MIKQEPSVAEALQVVRYTMQHDPEFAWAWHCSVAHEALNEGIIHGVANKIATRFMSTVFDTDTSPELYAKALEENPHD